MSNEPTIKLSAIGPERKKYYSQNPEVEWNFNIELSRLRRANLRKSTQSYRTANPRNLILITSNDRSFGCPIIYTDIIHSAILFIDVVISVKTCIGKIRCQDDIFPRIELIPSFVLSSDNTNYNNVI